MTTTESPVDASTPTKSRTYKQLCLHERQSIFVWHHHEKLPIREIAALLHRSPSTISREIRRHTSDHYLPCYYPQLAQNDFRLMKRNRGQRKRLKDDETRAFVEEKLKIGWSPEVISGRLKATGAGKTVCHEAIYQFIYKERRDLARYLPRKRVKQRSKFPARKRLSEPIPAKTPISQRPQEINHRISYGHWESDSIVDRNHTSINVIVERKTRLVHITKLSEPTSAANSQAIISCLSQHGRAFVQSITYDNGSGNARHTSINEKLGCQSFFCEPYHSWEKGLVENTNEKIRRFIPKKTDLASVTQEQLADIEMTLNNRPRKCLGYRTPNEAYQTWMAENETSLTTDNESVALTG